MGEVRRGDIYYIVSNYQEEGSEQRAGRPAVVVSNAKNNQHSGVIEVVYLTTRPKTDLPTHIDIRSSDRPSIALCEQICSVSKERLGSYIDTCTKKEMDLIDAALLISLGIDIPTDAPRAAKKSEPVAKPRPAPITDDEVWRLRMERDFYKELFGNLLDKFMRRKI